VVSARVRREASWQIIPARDLVPGFVRANLIDEVALSAARKNKEEELVFKEISTGAQNNLQRATDIAQSMVAEYGMSDRLRLVTYERPRQPMFLSEGFAPGKTYSEEKAGQIDEEVARVVEEAHQRVQVILLGRRKVLDDLAHLLSQKEIVQGVDLGKMFLKSSPWQISSCACKWS